MVFVTFPHLSPDHVQNSKFESVPQAQKVLFRYVLSLYQVATLAMEGHHTLTHQRCC